MLSALESPELVIGFCSPIGTENSKIGTRIKQELDYFKYNVVDFKVTEIMKTVVIPGLLLRERPTETRYADYIAYANNLREIFDEDGILGMMCCSKLRSHRRQTTGKPDKYIQRTCYIFDQFKRPEEIDVLRQNYGRLFILISIYSTPEQRKNRLSDRIADDHSTSRPTLAQENAALALMQRDENEEDNDHGQRIRDVFPMADLFVNADDMQSATLHIKRFFHAFFGSNRISPTGDEYAMYLAKTASLRSLDLSRQVGAAIFTAAHEVVSLGSNEVPKAGGGTYWCDDPSDRRDYKIGRDENDRIKRTILADISKRIFDTFDGQIQLEESDFLSKIQAESRTKNTLITKSELMDLLEFGRVIHAEMSAISDAARLGLSIKGTKLYCTTFPCHICAKHIVASGIAQVLFIEPYPKSYADKLHNDSIYVGALNEFEKRVNFAPFIGISPFRFRELFERKKRKDDVDGRFKEWADEKPRPIVRLTVTTYTTNEEAFTRILAEKWTELHKKGKVAGSDAHKQQPVISP
jgi:deoxycytidylate deaminase